MMAKFLILNSPNPKNVGIIREYSETFESSEVMKLTEEQVAEWLNMSAMERKFRLEEYRETNDKKKIFLNVVAAIKPTEKELVETHEFEEPLNEPINEIVENLTDSEYNQIKEEYKEKANEIANEHIEEMKEIVNEFVVETKAKRGRKPSEK